MDDMLLLYVAIGVFSLMVVGLALTVREFRTNIIVATATKPMAATSQEDGAARHHPQRVV